MFGVTKSQEEILKMLAEGAVLKQVPNRGPDPMNRNPPTYEWHASRASVDRDDIKLLVRAGLVKVTIATSGNAMSVGQTVVVITEAGRKLLEGEG